MAERYAGTFGIETEYIPDFIEDKKTLERLVDSNCYYYNSQGPTVILIGGLTITVPVSYVMRYSKKPGISYT